MSNMPTIEAVSLEYVRVQVTALKSGAAYDPTTDVVKIAFVLSGEKAATATWYTASWEQSDETYWAGCLVGPGGTATLTAGLYSVYVKVTDSPEVPVKLAGSLTVV